MVYAATDRLVVRFHSTAEKQDIDLKLYLGKAPMYYYNATQKNVIITVDQEGVAHISSKPGFEGVETIIFSTNESAIYEKQPQKEDYTFLENLTETMIEKYPTLVTDKDIQESLGGSLVDEILLKSIKKADLEKVTSEVKEDELMVNVNDEALVLVSFENQTKPKLTIVLFDEDAKVDENALKPDYKSYIIGGLIIIFVGFLMLYRDRLLTYFKRTRYNLVTKKKTLSKKLNQAGTGREIKDVMEDLFKEKFGLTRYSTPYETELTLNRYKIKGNLKQEILFLYRKFNEEHLSKYEVELIKKYLKRLNKKL
jgi:hypothetical protein